MKFFSRLFGTRREANLTTALERQRLGNTMPGQTGCNGSARLGFLSTNIAIARLEPDNGSPAFDRRCE